MDTQQIRRVLESEIVQVRGCTEPASVAFAVATALRTVGCRHFDPRVMRVDLTLSSEVLRNASTAVVPFMNRRGIKVVAAAGLSAGESVFNLFETMDLESARRLLRSRSAWLSVRSVPRKELFIQAVIASPGHVASATIRGRHDQIGLTKLDGQVVSAAQPGEVCPVSLPAAFEAARKGSAALEAVARDFVERQARKADEQSVDAGVSALIRARMAGSSEPIMTITGSGNQGLFIGVPFYDLYARQGEGVLPALVFALLSQVHLSGKKRRISGSCGLACKAAPALAGGLVFHQGGGLRDIRRVMRAVQQELDDMLCPGALPGCGKLASRAYRCVMKHAGSA